MSKRPAEEEQADGGLKKARVAVVGAGWWGQGWHLPQLQRNPDAEVAAIMEYYEQPTASKFLNVKLASRTRLREQYPGVPIYTSCEDMLADKETLAKIDGVIVSTTHKCHADMGMKFLAAGKHVLMEKPMTVDVAEARQLAAAAAAAAPQLAFMVNNSANFRDNCFTARRLVEQGELGDIHHVLCVMYAPLMRLFDDPANDSWVRPSGTMVQPDGSGNGFGWGQSCHAIAWPLFVGCLEVEEVTAMTHRSQNSGADLIDAALVRCKGGVSISLSAGCSWPGCSYGSKVQGKHFDIKMFGSKGVLMYGGDDAEPSSGRLELRRHDGTESSVADGFLMENCTKEGNGPESMQNFIAACRGLEYRNGANQEVGCQAVRLLDAMYRSAASGKTEKAR